MASLFGLPPGTSLSDVNKMADSVVFPVPTPGYHQASFGGELLFVPRGDESEMPMLFIQHPSASKVVVYSHANAEDIGLMYPILKRYSEMFEAHVVAYEFRGYGLAGGEPSEDAINEDCRTCYEFLTQMCAVDSRNVFFLGRSLGTGPSTWIASSLGKDKIPVGGLILMSPFKSISSLVKQHAGRAASMMVSNKWKNESAIKTVTCPLLIIHGEDDELIPPDHSKTMLGYAKTPEDQRTLNICPGADHNRFDEEYDVIIPIMSWLSPADILPPMPDLPDFQQYSKGSVDGANVNPNYERDVVQDFGALEDYSAEQQQLVDMGFDSDSSLSALLATGGNINRAMEMLLA